MTISVTAAQRRKVAARWRLEPARIDQSSMLSVRAEYRAA